MFDNDGGQNGHRQDEDAKDSARVMRRRHLPAILWRLRWSLVVSLVVVVLLGVSWVVLHRKETRKTDEDGELTPPLEAEDEPLPRQRKQARKGCPLGAEPTEPRVSEGGLQAQWCEMQDSIGSFIKHGWYREWYRSGALEEEEIFDSDYLKEGTVWNETGRVAAHSFYNNGVLKEMDFFDSDGHKVAQWHTTAKYREHTRPIRGLSAVHALPKPDNIDLTVFDPAGDTVVVRTAGGEMHLLAAGIVIANCHDNWPPVESECAPTPLGKNNPAKIGSALSAFQHMDETLREMFP